jgi:hypothetical protein
VAEIPPQDDEESEVMTARSTFASCLLLLSMVGTLALAGPPDGIADRNLFKAHMAFLADDLLEGRETGMRGFDIAARYVAGQFAQYGVQPKGDQGSYLQTVPLKTGRLVQDSPLFEIRRKGGVEALAYLDEFFMAPRLSTDQTDFTAPLVFVGFGITAPQFKHDDYAGIDVKDKIAILLSGNPPSFPSEEGAHYSSRRVKNELAAKHGAIGIIYLQTPRTERVLPFAKLRQYSDSVAMDWVTSDGRGSSEIPGVKGGALLSMAAASKLFSEIDVKLDAIYAAADANQPVPRMDLNLSARLAQKTTRSVASSSNVVGMIEGSDPVLQGEFVVFTAHLDHLGIKPGITGDNIYNGAMDNASGVATLLEMARLIVQMPVKPKRSILFIAVTGEEKGLLGSDYFATHPTVPASSMVACVNLDMPILIYDFNKVIAFGAERSSLKDLTAKAAAELKVELIADPVPEQALFIRSDQYSFVRQGVPSIFLVTGTGSFDKNENVPELIQGFLRSHYHQPSDDMSLPINWDAAERFAQLNYALGVGIANSPKRISWNAGDFFGDLFGK